MFLLNHYQVAGISNLLKTNLEKGVHGDDADLLKRRNAFGSNNYPRKKGRSFWVTYLGVIGCLMVVQYSSDLANEFDYQPIKPFSFWWVGFDI